MTDDWKPIETAPRDGTRVDLWVVPPEAPPSRVCDQIWNTDWGTWTKDAAPWYFTIGPWKGDTYVTHWMPVPAAPLYSA